MLTSKFSSKINYEALTDMFEERLVEVGVFGEVACLLFCCGFASSSLESLSPLTV
jgi:hypothetical protein